MKFLKALGLVLALAVPALGQVKHTFPAQDTTNVFTGNNTFANLNRTYYAGTMTYPTIQSAINAGCADVSGNTTVRAMVGTNVGTDITTLTGCTAVGVVDERVIPSLFYAWNGSAYVLQGGSGGGNVANQNANYVPLATGPTSLTATSKFFQNSTTSGVQNGFYAQAQTALGQCKNNGVTFTQYGCNNFSILDDGSSTGTTPRNLSGLLIDGNFWGPGGAGNSEARTSTLFGNSNNGAFVTPGIKITQASNMNHFGLGDNQGYQVSEAMHGGTAYQSDQGNQLIYGWVGEQGHWAGNVAAGGTSTSPKVTSSNAHAWCLAQQNQTCIPSPGGVMLDRSVVKSTGKFTTTCGGGPVAWLGSCTTDQTTIPVTSAYGIAAVSINPNTTWDAPVDQTITFTSGSGLLTTGNACVIGDQFFEQRTITSVSGTAGSQTIHIPLSKPETNVFIAQGDCGYLTLDADASHDIEMSIPALSLDGSHILASYPAFSSMFAYNGTNGYVADQHWAKFDGGVNSGYHLYAGARIDRIDTTRPTYAPFADDAIVLTLEPNTAFNVGDAICSPDFADQKTDGLELTAAQNQPGQVTGLRLHIGGNGASGAAAVQRFYNDLGTSNYAPFGGPLSEPAMTTTEGSSVFSFYHDAIYTPYTAIFHFNNHQPGQTSYDILNDPNWGILSLNANGLNFNNDWHGNSFYGNGVLSGIGLSAGPGNGGIGAGVEYRFGNGSTSSTWLAQEYSQGNTNDHLAVTKNGYAGGRTAGGGDYYALPNGILDAAVFGAGNRNGSNSTEQMTACPWAGNYNCFLFNGVGTPGGYVGFAAHDTADSDNNLYANVPTGFAYKLQINGGVVYNLDANGLALTTLPASTSPVCPNGVGGALTTTGCVGGGGGTTGGTVTGALQYRSAGGTTAGDNSATVDGSGNLTVNSLTTNTSVKVGSGTSNVYYTSSGTGVSNVGSTNGGNDATINAGSFYAQGGIVDGRSVVTTSTSLTINIDSTYGEEFVFFNGTGTSPVTFNLPTTPAAGMKRCIGTTNVDVALSLHAATGQTILYGPNATTSGGYVDTSSLGANACAVAITSTQWMLYPGVGTWVTH